MRILVAHDATPTSAPALDEAIRLARSSKAELVVFHAFAPPLVFVGDPTGMSAPPSAGERRAQMEILERIVTQARSFHVRARLRVTDEIAAPAILAAADDERAEIILLGTHSRTGLPRMLLGSIADSVVQASRRPVLVVRGARRSPLQPMEDFRVIVGVDFSPASLEAVGQAAGVARLLEGTLSLLHVCAPADALRGGCERAQLRLDAIASELRARGLTATPTVTIAEDPAAALVAEAEGDPQALIALGTRGRAPLAQWFLGSVSRDVMRNAPCPVLVAHSPLEGGHWDVADGAHALH